VELADETESQRIRELGQRLSRTRFQIVAALETTPYIDGVPSGTPRRIDVLWKDMILYIENKSMAKMAIAIAQELGRHFGRTDITDAIKLCFERDPVFVTEYLEENFKLLPPEKVGAETPGHTTQEEPISSPPDIAKERETDLTTSGNGIETESPPAGADTPESATTDVNLLLVRKILNQMRGIIPVMVRRPLRRVDTSPERRSSS
jgi:hypothetical protein